MTGAIQALLASTSLSGGSAPVSINNRTVSNTGTGTGTISVGYRLDSDGNAYKVTTATTLLEQWLDSGTAGQFEVRATKTSGTTPTGSGLGTWLALSSDRTWTLSAGAGASTTCALTVEIRDVATQTVQDSANITLSAVNTSGGGGGGGGGGGSVSISDRTVSNTGNATSTISASYQLNSDGNAYKQAGALLEAWLDSGVAGDFQVRATVQSGSLTSGTTGAWQALSTSRTWTVSAAPGVDNSCSVKIEIRDASSLTVLDSAIIIIQAFNSVA